MEKQISIMHEEEIKPSDVISHDLIIINISREHVEQLSFDYIDKVVAVLQTCKTGARQKAVILFSGYDDVPDEIFEIAAIRNWATAVIEKYPHFFYFITNFNNNAVFFSACIGDIKKVLYGPRLAISEYIKMGIDPNTLANIAMTVKLPLQIIKKILISTFRYGYEIGESDNNIVKVLNCLPLSSEV